MRARGTPQSFLLRRYFCSHWARNGAHSWCSSQRLGHAVRNGNRSIPVLASVDVTLKSWQWKAALLTLPAQSIQKSRQSPECWDIRKCVCIYIYLHGFFLFPIWVVAFEGQLFKLYLLTTSRKSCVHKPFPALHTDPLGGNVSFYFGSSFVPFSRGDSPLWRHLQG